MVVRTGTNEIHFADFDRWAEPLGQGIGRVVKATLSSARNVEEVALNSQGGGAMDYDVAVGILACEGVRLEQGGGSIRFAATWDMRSVGNNPTVIHGDFSGKPVAWDGKDYGQLAERLSEAIAGAARALAAALPVEATAPGPTATEETKP
jgi:uncharacterized lipoprotein YmbA